MALRKAAAYFKLKRPYTRRSRVKSKAYIKTIPPMKLTKFTMGNIKKYLLGGYGYGIDLVSADNAQTRDVSLEAARQFVHRNLEEQVGDYYFAIVVYPHHVLRENKMLTGAGADRMQTGMALSFGASMGNAVQLHEGKKIFVIAVSTEDAIKKTRRFLNKIQPKLSVKTKIIASRLKMAEKPVIQEKAAEVEAVQAI